MRSRWIRVFFASLLIILSFSTFALLPRFRSSARANRLTLEAVAHMYPKFTLQQHMALLREMQMEKHPRGKDLSKAEILMRMLALVTESTQGTGTAPSANFVGNLTAVAVANGDLMTLSRQSDCSLTLRDAVDSLNLTGPVFSYTLNASTPHYE